MQALRYQINAVPEVPYTKTWAPVHHAKVLDVLDETLDKHGIGVADTKFELIGPQGEDMFGTYRLSLGPSRAPFTIGVRNSMRKNFRLGFTAGNQVMVCSNLCFSGEYMEHRKHTSGLTMITLQAIVFSAVDQAVDKCAEFSRWFDSLGNKLIFHHEYKQLVYDAVQTNVVRPTEFHRFEQAFNAEIAQNGTGFFGDADKWVTMRDFHGACTRMLREAGPATIHTRSREINEFCSTH